MVAFQVSKTRIICIYIRFCSFGTVNFTNINNKPGKLNPSAFKGLLVWLNI